MATTPRYVHRRRLRAWRTHYETRDDKIRDAFRDGLSEREITKLTGLARNTVRAATATVKKEKVSVTN